MSPEIDGLQVAVQVDDTLNDPADTDVGWTVEIAIPWRSLASTMQRPLPPGPGDIWRVNLARIQWRIRNSANGYRKILTPGTALPLPRDNWAWSPQGLNDMHYPEMWGEVLFVDQGGGAFAEATEHNDIFVANLLMPLFYLQNRWRQDHGRLITPDLTVIVDDTSRLQRKR